VCWINLFFLQSCVFLVKSGGYRNSSALTPLSHILALALSSQKRLVKYHNQYKSQAPFFYSEICLDFEATVKLRSSST
jgi:hypothetical protein